MFSCGKIKEAWGANHPRLKPHFSPQQKEKTGVLRGHCGIQKFNKVIMPRVIFEAKEADAVPRGPYPRTVRLERRALVMSMAHHYRRSQCRGRVLERRLVLTCLKGW